MASRPLTVLGAASSAGSYGPGQERAPQELRDHGLVERLAAAGLEVTDVGDVVSLVQSPDPDHPDAGHVIEVRSAIEAVAAATRAAFQAGADVLVLGGDCTVELGTVAGALADGSSVGLVYVDLDGDLNTPATGDGILDWMGLAHLLGVPGALPELVEVGPRTPLLPPEAVVLVAVDRLTEAETATAERLALRRESLAAVVDDLDGVLERLTGWAEAYDRVLVHVDVDVLDYQAFPIAHEVRDVPGLSVDELARLTRGLRQLPGWAALTICEINPDHATDPDAQLERLVTVITEAVAP